jgi:hypothetical protein
MDGMYIKSANLLTDMTAESRGYPALKIQDKRREAEKYKPRRRAGDHKGPYPLAFPFLMSAVAVQFINF